MITRDGSFTRRTFGRICAGAWLAGRRLLRAKEAAPLSWAVVPDSRAGLERRYRADAQIILLSIPVLHRSGVGDGAAIWRESNADDGTVVRLLEFTGRSAPEHAAGLNRFGFIQELSRTNEGTCAESIYFGLMTSSTEENAADARKALHSNSKEASFSAIEGRVAERSVETTAAHFIAPARTSVADRSALMESARQALSGAPKKKDELRAVEPMPRPFLHTLAELLRRQSTSQAEYVYNGRVYSLRVERSADPKAAAGFRDQQLIAPAAKVVRIAGAYGGKKATNPSNLSCGLKKGWRAPCRCVSSTSRSPTCGLRSKRWLKQCGQRTAWG